jgi:cytochrome c oxidase subunit 2
MHTHHMSRLRIVVPRSIRAAAVLLAASSLILLAGCGWAGLDGPQSTISVSGPVARAQLDVFKTTVYVTTFIFVVVGAVLAYATIKFRARDAADATATPPAQSHGNPLVEVALIAASVLLLAVIAVPTLKNIWYTHDVPEAERANALEVVATGYQWWFKFEYPSEKTPQPAGGEAPLVTANELVIPAGRAVRVQLRTVDVIHSFWVPKLAGKVDMIPNRGNHLWLKADQPGYFYGQCAEYCGESHAIMRFRVIALATDDYARWLDNQKRPARAATVADVNAARPAVRAVFASAKLPSAAAAPGRSLAASPEFDANPFAAWKQQQLADPARENAALVAAGRRLFTAKTCIACHTIRGHEGAVGITGPDLTHVGARTTIAAGVLENTPSRMRDWITDPNHWKPGNKMFVGGYTDAATGRRLVNLNETEITSLVAYLQSLK